MSRYIDADNVMSAFDRVCNNCGMRDTVICDSCKFDGARVIVENTPTEDVKPIVRGEWKNLGFGYGECSVCGNRIMNRFVHNFCSNCGAEMSEESEEEE